MRTETIQARIDPQTKAASKAVLNELGMSVSEAINIYLKRIVAEKGIPFDVKIFNKETIKAFEEKNLQAYNSVDELMKEFE